MGSPTRRTTATEVRLAVSLAKEKDTSDMICHTVNRDKRIAFAKKHISEPEEFSNKVIFRDKRKFNIFGSNGRIYAWLKPDSELLAPNTIPTVKHERSSVLLWGSMSATEVGISVFIDGIMDNMKYLDILNLNLKQSAQKLSLRSNSIFQQNNDLKLTAEIVKLRLVYKYKMRLRTPPQSPDLNIIEKLLSKLEISVQKHNIRNKEHLKTVLQPAGVASPKLSRIRKVMWGG
ncbi:Transposable element Tcb1 transposase [Araneus ventricosus]|uniref:Transposable element Tcb1 transposase n=1 Tax=Araneus ventricosus TaxID=182803 RepID=A0A4Y2N4C4_ARAVE|nr:Transposable element Tcb1 transposase [Araneus ventricosus]